jgi:hypothetical protein
VSLSRGSEGAVQRGFDDLDLSSRGVCWRMYQSWWRGRPRVGRKSHLVEEVHTFEILRRFKGVRNQGQRGQLEEMVMTGFQCSGTLTLTNIFDARWEGVDEVSA